MPTVHTYALTLSACLSTCPYCYHYCLCAALPQEVDKEMATAYAEEIGALYLETSAKDDTNVQDIFVKLSKW